MMQAAGSPARPRDVEECVDALIESMGRDLRVGLPLGLGKPNRLVNALYLRARSDPSLKLSLYTALTLEAPGIPSGLRGRLAGPIIRRLYDGYPALEHQRDLRAGRLPANVSVHEFFFTPASLLGCPPAQRAYLASNYTHVARDLLARGANAILQLVAREGDRYSLSCNPDVTLDLMDMVRAGQRPFAMVGQVHRDLPFMEGDAVVGEDYFDFLLEEPEDFTLFVTPRQAVSSVEHRIGMNASALVRDGGTLQIGIGALGDAVAYALTLRQNRNDVYRDVLNRWGVTGAFGDVIEDIGGLSVFERGLYGCSEMLVDGFLQLINAGIVKRPAGEGDDAIMHGGFFLGPPDFYSALRNLPADLRRRIHMTSVGRINQLYGDEALRRRQRRDARFINSCLKVTLSGSVVSDALEDHRVLSGVGGQYNFVAMAHALADGRSMIMARSTRGRGRELESNIVWDYGNITIPRHLRDLVITEYGIADLRGRSDEECIRAMLCIADSRFQEELRKEAVRAGKLDASWRIPDAFRRNTPQRIATDMESGTGRDPFPEYPFGSELSADERRLARALGQFRDRFGASRFKLGPLLRTLWAGATDPALEPLLERMDLDRPRSLSERLQRRLVLGALKTASKAPR